MTLLAPFPYFGGKRTIAADVWERLGAPTQYIEPFCGSAAMLLAVPKVAALEVVNDVNGFIVNFWRAVKHQPRAVAEWADYPVSHLDLGARHGYLMEQRGGIANLLADPNWGGDAQVAGWWLWGQCCWIGSGWCEWERGTPSSRDKVPHTSDAGRGIHAIGQMPHTSSAGRAEEIIPAFWTSGGATAFRWLTKLAARLERARVIHGAWERCLNNHFGGDDTAYFLDPPYRAYEKVYGDAQPVIADAVEAWARDNARSRIALCGHLGDYDLPGWDMVKWSRGRFTYGGNQTTDSECIWYSPACLPRRQQDLFSLIDPAEERLAEAFIEPEIGA